MPWQFPRVREFDSGADIRDLLETGAPLTLIMIALERREENGINRCARWLCRHLQRARVVHFLWRAIIAARFFQHMKLGPHET
jgi:hypothetical protein